MSEPTRVRAPARYEAALFALAGAALLLSQLGYSFERGDQLQYLLLPYRSIYPDFLPGDWFTWHTTHYHHTFSYLVVAIHALSGESAFAAAMLVAQIAVLIALSYAIWRLSRACGFGLAHAAFALSVLALVREQGLAGDTLNHAQLVPSDIALPPFLLACAAWLEQRTLRAGVWLGLSGLLHANFAVLGPLVLIAPEAWFALRDQRWRGLFSLLLPYALIASPTLWLTARGFLAADSAPAAISIMLQIRSPHHYDLSAFSSEDVAWLGVVLIAGSPAWLAGSMLRDRPRTRWLLLALVGVLLLGLAGSIAHVTALVRLFVWRLSIPLIVIALFVAAESAASLMRNGSRWALLWVASCAAVIATFVRDDLPLLGTLGLHGGWFVLPAALPLLAAGILLARNPRPHPALLVALVALPLLFSASVSASPLAGARSSEEETQQAKKIRGPRLGEFLLHPKPSPLFERVRNSTPAGTTFMISPSLIGFRLQARRAAYVDWKCVPMKGEEALEWQRRMLAVFGTRDFPIKGYELRKGSGEIYMKRDLRELAALAHQEHVDFLIANRSSKPKPDMGLEPRFVSGGWRVYRVIPPAETAEHTAEHARDHE